MTIPSISVRFYLKPNGWHHIHPDFSNRLPASFKRTRGDPLVLSPDHRLKAWGTDLDQEAMVINGIDVRFVRRGPQAFQAQLAQADADAIRQFKPPLTPEQLAEIERRKKEREEKEARDKAAWERARQDRVQAGAAEFATVFGVGGIAPTESPTTHARRWCRYLYDRDGERTDLFWAFRSWINGQETWDRRKPLLEETVRKELIRGREWIERWTAFRQWWAGIPRPAGVYNNIYLKLLQQKFDDDLGYMREQVEITEQHGWRGELLLAAEETGLEEWPETEDWDDGLLWMRHPDTGVLFPYHLYWLHMPDQGSAWTINTNFSVNQWALGQHPPADQSQDVAWRFLNFYLQKGTTTVGPDFKLTSRLLPYVGGYQQRPNHLFRPCLEMVKAHAAMTPPPEPIPCI